MNNNIAMPEIETFDGARVKLMNDGTMRYSQGVQRPSLDIGRMTLKYCLTSPVLDRERDVVLADAPDWSDHKKNPITLFNHKLDKPFGVSRDPEGNYTVERVGDKWYGTSWLHQNDPFAEEVFFMAEQGALNAASLGFLAACPPHGESVTKSKDGYDYTVIKKCKIFEWSAVYIGMNQEALLVAAEMVHKGMRGKKLSDRALEMFLPYVSEKRVWENGHRFEPQTKFVSSLHPRDDHGVFIPQGSIAAAAGDEKQAQALRSRTTNHTQLAALNAAIHRAQGGHQDAEKRPGELHGNQSNSGGQSAGGQASMASHKPAGNQSVSPQKPPISAEQLFKQNKPVGDDAGHDDKSPIDFASDNGKTNVAPAGSWPSVCGWIHKQKQGDDDDEKEHFRKFGWSQNPKDLADQLTDALDNDPPEDPDVAKIIEAIIDMIDNGDNDEFVAAVAASGGDEDGGEDEDTEEKPDKDKDMSNKKAYAPPAQKPASAAAVNPTAQPGDALVNEPVMPLGSQFLGGLHHHQTQAAKFFAENLHALEPESASFFLPLEKGLMSSIKTTASMHNGRYPGLPPLDGDDWTDPDAASTDINPEAEHADGSGDPLKQDQNESSQKVNDSKRAGDLEDEKDSDIGSTGDKGKDSFKKEREKKGEKKIPKSLRRVTGSIIKAYVDATEARILKRENERRTIIGPEADMVVKQIDNFFLAISQDTRIDGKLRRSAVALATNLKGLKVAPVPVAVPVAPIVPVAPVAVEIDTQAVLDKLGAYTKSVGDEMGSLLSGLTHLKLLAGING